MGGGKGAPDHYVCTVKPGTVMFELGGVAPDKAMEALKLVAYKLPLKAKVVKK